MRLIKVWQMLIGPLLLAAALPANAQPADVYRVNPGDVLSVHIWNEESLSRPEILVRPDGYISTPILGEVAAGGQTITEISTAIASGLKAYLRDDPVVTVSVAAISGNTIYVLGKVARPGQFVIRSATDVTQALAMAGGITTFANESAIKILRRDQQGEQRAIRFRYNKVKDGDRLDDNIVLQSGDVVLVP